MKEKKIKATIIFSVGNLKSFKKTKKTIGAIATNKLFMNLYANKYPTNLEKELAMSIDTGG